MMEHYLSNKNESATVAKFSTFTQLLVVVVVVLPEFDPRVPPHACKEMRAHLLRWFRDPEIKNSYSGSAERFHVGAVFSKSRVARAVLEKTKILFL